MTSSVTINIHTFNEEKNIEECIQSAQKLTKKIYVIDMQSTDQTVVIAKKMGAEVYSFPYSHYVEPSRQFGIEKADTDWVFILDADERMTKQLAEEVLSVIASTSMSLRAERSNLSVNSAKQSQKERSLRHFVPRDDKFTYYKVSRKNIYADKWLKHGGWWPDYQIRLINKKYFKKWPKEIHSTPVITGKQGFLTNPLLHYFHGDIEEMVKKTIIFEDIESDLLFQANRPVNTGTFFRKCIGELFRRLIRHFGFLDGSIGIIESIYQAFSKTITYLFLYEKKLKSKSV